MLTSQNEWEPEEAQRDSDPGGDHPNDLDRDKNSMLDKREQFARDAKAQEAQVICFQELFYGPYFGITEDAK